MNEMRLKTTIIVILTNLLLGNAFLLSSKSINFPLVIGMSVVTIVFYILFFKFSNFEYYGYIKMLLLSFLSCMIIIVLGNSIAVIIADKGLKMSVLELIFMGVLGNIVMYPFWLGFGILNFMIINFLKS